MTAKAVVILNVVKDNLDSKIMNAKIVMTMRNLVKMVTHVLFPNVEQGKSYWKTQNVKTVLIIKNKQLMGENVRKQNVI